MILKMKAIVLRGIAYSSTSTKDRMYRLGALQPVLLRVSFELFNMGKADLPTVSPLFQFRPANTVLYSYYHAQLTLVIR